MKHIIILSFLLLTVKILHGQTAPGFNKHFTTQYPNSTIYKVLVDNDTIVTLGLGYRDTINWEKGLVLMKLDTMGNLLQEAYVPDTLFGGQATLLLHIRYGSLLKTTDNGYILNVVPFLFSHPVVLKTDHEFNIEFIKEYTVLNEGVDYMLSELKPINDGYLLHGSFKRSNGMSDGYVGKINFEGDSIWMRNYGNFGSSETVVDVKLLDDTTYAVSMVYNIGTGSALSSIKVINQYGDILENWNSEPNPEIGFLRDIISVDEEGYLVYGLYPVAFLPPFTYVVKSTISRLDKDFNILWSKHYGGEVTLSSELMFFDFDKTIDGNYLATGKTNIEVPDAPDISTGWLMKFSPEGDSIWSRLDTALLSPALFGNQHALGGAGVLSSGSIVAGGYVRKQNDYYAWLIKVTNDGCLDTLYCGLVNAVEEEAPEEEVDRVNIYPNPASDFIHIEAAGISAPPYSVSLYDATGRQVRAYPDTGDGRLSVPTYHLPNGMYLLALKFPDGSIQNEKVIVQH